MGWLRLVLAWLTVRRNSVWPRAFPFDAALTLCALPECCARVGHFFSITYYEFLCDYEPF